jgi:hypothetical protein
LATCVLTVSRRTSGGHEDGPDLEEVGDRGGPKGSRPTARDQHVTPGIVTALGRDETDGRGDVVVSDPDDAVSGLDRVEAERLADRRADRPDRGRPVERDGPARDPIRQATEHEVGIGDGRQIPSQPVTRRTRATARAPGPDRDQAVPPDHGDAPTARTDRVDIEHRQGDRP